MCACPVCRAFQTPLFRKIFLSMSTVLFLFLQINCYLFMYPIGTDNISRLHCYLRALVIISVLWTINIFCIIFNVWLPILQTYLLPVDVCVTTLN